MLELALRARQHANFSSWLKALLLTSQATSMALEFFFGDQLDPAPNLDSGDKHPLYF